MKATDTHKFTKHFLEVTLALPLKVFLSQEGKFIGDFEYNLMIKHVRCKIAEIHMVSSHRLVVNLYCFFGNEHNNSNIPMAIYIPTVKLKQMMSSSSLSSSSSENVKEFLHKYNVTNLFSKNQNTSNTALVSTAIPLSQQEWFPTAMAVGGSILLLSVVILICICCRKAEKIVEGEEVKSVNSVTFEKSPNLSPISSHGKNTFTFSPKKCFSYSPNKQAPTIFSFSSPKKYNNEIIYPTTESAFEMSPPFRVQPQLDLLYPPTRDSPASLSALSSGDEKQRTLLQSRRGSSASLIIDLSPKSPLQDNVLILAESPTEEILKHKSKNLTYKDLCWYKEDSNTLYEEFWNIPPNTVSRKNSQLRFSLKNRYPDIIPNAWSTVRFENADQNPVYINANFVSGFDKKADEYIATQGPLPCTVDDFWLMVWKFKCSVITMITKLREKHKEKCVQYWPSEKVPQERYGDTIVTYDSEVQRDGYCITTLYISHKGSTECRKVTHFWFTSWPDHKVPNDTQQILSLIHEVRQVQKSTNSSSPIIVHCSAGRGRTGCFIAISMGISRIDSGETVDILKIVSHIRIYRGGLVDKVHQYIFVHKALYDYWTLKHPQPVTSPSITTTHRLQDQQREQSSDPIDSPTSPI